MTTNYDPIAEQYKRSKQQPWCVYVEAFTLMRLIGDPTGKKVIDIACGEGFYTRMIRQRGAAKVTGVDLSEKMIELARASESEQRLGIDYIVGDGRDLGVTADYDLAVAAYFLNYAHDRAELNAMCSGIARCLKPGGRFVLGVPNCVNLRKRITVPLGIGKWSRMSDWYEEPVFRAHVREPDVDDLWYIARDMSLKNPQILGRNWLAYDSPFSIVRLLIPMLDGPLRFFPRLCANIYLTGTT